MPTQKRTEIRSLRLTPAELAAVRRAAAALDMPPATYMRRSALAAARRVEATAVDDAGAPIFSADPG